MRLLHSVTVNVEEVEDVFLAKVDAEIMNPGLDGATPKLMVSLMLIVWMLPH